jgi:hypothetical protein
MLVRMGYQHHAIWRCNAGPPHNNTLEHITISAVYLLPHTMRKTTKIHVIRWAAATLVMALFAIAYHFPQSVPLALILILVLLFGVLSPAWKALNKASAEEDAADRR